MNLPKRESPRHAERAGAFASRKLGDLGRGTACGRDLFLRAAAELVRGDVDFDGQLAVAKHLHQRVLADRTRGHQLVDADIAALRKEPVDVADIDDVATSFQDLNFIVEHCGLPRLDDFCWIATQETNVYGGLAVVLPFIHTRPGYFGHVMAELLFWIGPDKILYGSDYGIWTPKWLIDKFMAFEIPADITKETGSVLSLETKTKILGLNAARIYGIDVEAQKKKIKAGGGYAHLPEAVHAPR